MDSFYINRTTQDHKNLTCFLCTRYYNYPRILPCRHIFCSSCIKTLQDKSSVTYPRREKISCPTCKAFLDVPAEGIEGFPLDHKTQALKEKAIQDLAQKISESVKNPREDTSSRFSSTSPLGDIKSNHNQKAGFQSANAYRDFSKFAKYFNKESSDANSEYKPSIRADHTRSGYESSTRFRNRKINSKERQGSEEKEFRRRTWYGSTLQSRRAQSLNRTSMFVDDQEKKNPENLFRISEDKEQTIPGMTTGDSNSGKSSFKRSNFTSRYKVNEENSDFLQSKSAKVNDFEDTQNREFLSNSRGSRTALPTHRENIVTSSFVKYRSKEKSTSDEPEMSFRRSKSSPKRTDFHDKIFTSQDTSQEANSRGFESSDKSSDKHEPQTFVGSRHHRLKKSKGTIENWKDDKQFECKFDFNSDKNPGRPHSIASRDKLHLDIDMEERNVKLLEHDFRQDPSPRRSRSRKVKSERCRSVELRYSLNKNDFNSESAFRDHLLNMTMSKEKYQLMMEDFKKEQLNDMRSDSCGFDADPEDLQETIKNKDVDKENIKQNTESESGVNILADESFKSPREPLIDENLISSFRVKYSSPLNTKRFPKQDTCPDYCEGVTKRWSYQKNEYGIPTSAVFLSSGNLVVSEYGLSYLEFFDTCGHLEHSITGIKPYGLTLSMLNQNIIVGDRKGKCIRIFDEFGADVSQIDNLENIEWLAGIATRRDGGLILCDRGRCKILICNTSGERIREFGSFGSSMKQLCMADFLTVDSKNRILVADSGNHCIKIFDSDGNFLKTVGNRGNGNGQMEWPKGIAVDQNDNIIVADTLNHRISLFSPDGLFVKQIMTSIPDPYNITYSHGLLGVLHHNLNGMSEYDIFTC